MAAGMIVKVIQTCSGCPSQWDAWRDDGQYLYLRYRHGCGSVEAQPSPDWNTWDDSGSALLVEWNDETQSGWISLYDFLAAAGMELASNADVT